MATSRDFVYDEQGEMLPSDSAAAAARRKELDDDARTVSDAKDAAKAPAKAPVAAKAKSGIVTKEELAKSGLSLRDYMNNQRGLTRRDGKVALRKGDMDIKSPAEKRSATRMADVAAKKPQAERRSDTRLRASKASATSSDEANMFKKGGSVRGVGIAQRGVRKCKMV